MAWFLVYRLAMPLGCRLRLFGCLDAPGENGNLTILEIGLCNFAIMEMGFAVLPL
jgi:hypothetical protein